MPAQEVALEVARILLLMATVPNTRRQPNAGDLQGEYDRWFDGGAYNIVTGVTEYFFANGSRASVQVLPWLSVSIKLPDGTHVGVSQDKR